jgi:hypothetical protein
MTCASIRRIETKDLDACYAISLATGLAGGDASHLYRDPRMMGHIYIAPYALLEPDLTLVVEDDTAAPLQAGQEVQMEMGRTSGHHGRRRWCRGMDHERPALVRCPLNRWNAAAAAQERFTSA